MKKLFTILTLLVAMIAPGAMGQTSLSSKEAKAIEKDSKKMCKKLEKEGWKPLAATKTLEFMLIRYNTYMAEDDNRIPLNGIAIGKNNKIGRQNATSDAINSYARRATAQVVGKVKDLVNTDNLGENVQDIDKFGAAYESEVTAKLSNLIKEHFVLVKELPNGNREYNAFLSIDETQARKAREEAARSAQEKAHLKDFSEEVREFIGQPVAGEE